MPSPELVADCASCVGICCIVPGFGRSADFAFDKPARQPCRHLDANRRCSIHQSLEPHGMQGCMAYDCFGAGQAVTASLGLRPSEPLDFAAVEPVFRTVEAANELRWLLADAAARRLTPPLASEVRRLSARLASFSNDGERNPAVRNAGTLAEAVAELTPDVSNTLRLVSREVRGAGAVGRDARRAAAQPDLVGARLPGADLRGVDLRGRLLLGADLSRADLTRADLLGADLRGADLRGTDLTDALFVTVRQLRAARLDAATRLPGAINRALTAASPAQS